MQSSNDDEEKKSGKGARWKKCPICEDTVYLHEVRPVRFYAGQESPLPRVGDDVVLRLMARNASSTMALPREGGSELLNSGDDVPWHSAANVLDYARIMKGSKEYMTGQHEEEIAALEEQEKMDDMMFGQDNEWTQKAIKAINTAKERVLTAEDDVAAVSVPGAAPSSHAQKPNAKHSRQASDADFYFYSSPPHLYLSPLDIRILKTHFGAFSNFPSTLLPRVEHISTGHAVDDAMRKRAKYLAHLPRGCVISYLECDWTDIIPAEILETFSKDIERRRKQNRDKVAQEDRERFQAEKLEAAAMRLNAGTHRAASVPIENDEPPRMDLSEFQPLGSTTQNTPPERPGFESLADMSTSPSTQRTVWGTRAIENPGEEHEFEREHVDDGWDLGSAELAMQMEALRTYDQSGKEAAGLEGTSVQGAAPGGGGKKKGKGKKQKITLMSTGGRRGI